MLQNLLEALRRLEIPVSPNEPLSAHTTLRIGGPAACFCRPETSEQAVSVIRLCVEHAVPYVVVGNGSNLLAADAGYHGVVLCTTGLDALSIDPSEPSIVCCGAGAMLGAVSTFAQKQSLSGMAFAYGIPGTVGGAVVMNAGAYGGEVKDVLLDVTFYENGAIHTLPSEELDLRYRHSCFAERDAVILSARFRLQPGDSQEILTEMRDYMSRRKEKQPLEYPSAGSTFKRPQGAYAAALIDQCGLKGRSVGDAQVSEKHAGFLINRGSATCADMLALIHIVQDTVREQTGFDLEPEVQMLP